MPFYLTCLLNYDHSNIPSRSYFLVVVYNDISCLGWGRKYHTFDQCFLDMVCSWRFLPMTKFVKWHLVARTLSIILKYTIDMLSCVIVICHIFSFNNHWPYGKVISSIISEWYIKVFLSILETCQPIINTPFNIF